MKKILTLMMFLLLAASAFAQFKYSGVIRMRGNANNYINLPNYDVNSYNWINPRPNAPLTANWVPKKTKPGIDYAYLFLKSGPADTTLAKDYRSVEKFMDLRFRPTLEYKINENLNSVWTAEIGDINYGYSSKGGGQGADGINVETKNLFFDWTFLAGHKVRVGIQNYMDPMVLVVEDDFAGVTYDADWSNLVYGLNTKIGWLKGRDDGSKNYLKDVYDYGYSNYIADVRYQLNQNNYFGVNYLFQNMTQDATTLIDPSKLCLTSTAKLNQNQFNNWIAPYFKGRPMYELSVEAELVLNFRHTEYDLVYGEFRENVDAGAFLINKRNFIRQPENEFGWAMQAKTNYKVNEDFDFGINFLYASGQALSADRDSSLFLGLPSSVTGAQNDPRSTYLNDYTKAPINYYRGATPSPIDKYAPFNQISRQTTGGLEILGTNGVNDSRGISPAALGEYFGSIMPVLYANYKITPNHTIGFATGFAMTAEEVYYQTVKNEGGVQIQDPADPTNANAKVWSDEKTDNKSNFIGFEIDLNGSLKFDKFTISPVAAFFFPGDMFQVREPGTGFPTTDRIQNTVTAPAFFEIGLKTEFRF